MLNQVNLIGRMGSTPELRQTQSDKSVCSFSLATTDGYGESQRTEWHRVVAWEKTAEFLAQHVDSGRLVSVVGRLKTRTYERDGVTHKVTEVVAHSVQLLDKKPAQDKHQDVRQHNKPGTGKTFNHAPKKDIYTTYTDDDGCFF